MDKHSIDYLSTYIKLTDKIKQKIESHARRYNIKAEICAWYSDWEDFCSDWCDDCGYTRTEARKLYHGGIGEFMARFLVAIILPRFIGFYGICAASPVAWCTASGILVYRYVTWVCKGKINNTITGK